MFLFLFFCCHVKVTFHWLSVTCIYCILNPWVFIFFPYKAFIYHICIILTFLISSHVMSVYWSELLVKRSFATGLNAVYIQILPTLYTVQESMYVIFSTCVCVCVNESVCEREPVFALMWKSAFKNFDNFFCK